MIGGFYIRVFYSPETEEKPGDTHVEGPNLRATFFQLLSFQSMTRTTPSNTKMVELAPVAGSH